MATVQRFEDLSVWQKARLLADAIYQLTQNGSFSKDYEPINQINRASGSVMDTIAEGFGRGSRAEFKQFLGFSLGSISEVKSQLYRAADEAILHPINLKNFITLPTV
ncbi:four helix bundle protein [Larkinella harenae]